MNPIRPTFNPDSGVYASIQFPFTEQDEKVEILRDYIKRIAPGAFFKMDRPRPSSWFTAGDELVHFDVMVCITIKIEKDHDSICSAVLWSGMKPIEFPPHMVKEMAEAYLNGEAAMLNYIESILKTVMSIGNKVKALAQDRGNLVAEGIKPVYGMDDRLIGVQKTQEVLFEAITGSPVPVEEHAIGQELLDGDVYKPQGKLQVYQVINCTYGEGKPRRAYMVDDHRTARRYYQVVRFLSPEHVFIRLQLNGDVVSAGKNELELDPKYIHQLTKIYKKDGIDAACDAAVEMVSAQLN